MSKFEKSVSLFSTVHRISILINLIGWKTLHFKRPTVKSLLIYDREGSENLVKHLNIDDIYILDTRLESINLNVLIINFLLCKFSYDAYLEAIISCVRPRCILTFIDNNKKFYLLKEKFPDVVTIFVQNGTRGEIGDIFGYTSQEKKYKVDLMLVHGEAVGRKYESWIKGKAISIGSIKNNSIPIENRARQKKEKKTLLFTSTYTIPPVNHSEPLWQNGDGTFTRWKQFYEAEDIILPFLRRYSIENDMLIQICGRLREGRDQEFKYYEPFFSKMNWEFLERKGEYSSYGYMDNADLTVNIDSTIGYEGLARGNRVAFLSIRGLSLNSKAANFGWPGAYEDEGPIWTNNADDKSFERVLNEVLGMSEVAWSGVTQPIKSQLMNYDPGNRRFIHIVNEVINS